MSDRYSDMSNTIKGLQLDRATWKLKAERLAEALEKIFCSADGIHAIQIAKDALKEFEK